MTDYRSEAEKFVTAFLDYVYVYGINDEYDPDTNDMRPSDEIEALIEMAEAVFPERRPGGESAELMRELSPEAVDAAIEAAPNVIDTREQFSLKIQQNGGLRAIIAGIVEGKPEAFHQAQEFYKAEKGEKDFHVPTKE